MGYRTYTGRSTDARHIGRWNFICTPPGPADSQRQLQDGNQGQLNQPQWHGIGDRAVKSTARTQGR